MQNWIWQKKLSTHRSAEYMRISKISISKQTTMLQCLSEKKAKVANKNRQIRQMWNLAL